MDLDLSELRDATLRRIGRNVVNFQKLETALKSLVPATNASGTLSELAAKRAVRQKELRKMPLGHLTKEFHSGIYGGAATASEPSDLTEAHFSLSMRVEADPETIRKSKQSLLALVKERNRLIHSDLACTDFNSSSECSRISAMLDEQNERLSAQLQELAELRRAHVMAIKLFVAAVESGEFASEARRPTDDA
jgi:hypothetical protein